uniref:Odorant binding protein OBP26 n=1 Tax=Sitodiplosis mosellana TaxID=263140 RepID=A0A977WKP2_9DIPT|nr:odorant binding protein OBP26 [Sitodiplosis mosellana]
MKFLLCALLIALASAHEPPGLFEYTKCCKIQISAATTQFIDSMTKLEDECKQELGEPEQGKPPKFPCFHECVGNKTNMINADESLNEDKYRSFITTQMATEDYQKAVADAIATKCIEKVNSADGSEESPDGCSETAMEAFHCASKELINACPADKQDNDEHCVHFREFINRDFKGKGPQPSPQTVSK